jgi:hypothetical protein
MKTICAALAATTVLATAMAAEARTTILNFDDLAKPGVGADRVNGPSFDYGDFRFTSTYSEAPHFLFWRQDAAENADRGGGTFAHRWDRFPLTIGRIDNATFDLVSFDFADILNSGKASSNSITLTYGNGRIETIQVTSDKTPGLQTLLLDRKGVQNIAIAAQPEQWWQLDNFTVSAGVPEPATWAMMILGFGGIGATLRRRRLATA